MSCWIHAVTLLYLFTFNLVHCQLTCNSDVNNYRNAFKQPSPTEKDVVFVDYDSDIEMKLARNITKLHISIGTEIKTVDLGFLYNLQMLKELWFSYHLNTKDCLTRNILSILLTGDKNTTSLPIEKLHINVRTLLESQYNVLWPILQTLPKLQLLDLSGSYIFGNNPSARFGPEGFHFKNIKALSLRQTSYTMDSLKALVFDLKAILYAFEESPLEYLDIRDNHLTGVRGSITALLPQLRMIDASQNYFQEDFTALALLEVFILHPKIEIIIIEELASFDVNCFNTIKKKDHKRDIFGSTEDNLRRYKRDRFASTAEISKTHKRDIITGDNLRRHKRDIFGRLGDTIIKCIRHHNTTKNDAIVNHDIYCKVVLCVFVELAVIPSFYDYYKEIPCKNIPPFAKLLSLQSESCFKGMLIPPAPNLCEVRFGSLYTSKTFLSSVTDNRNFCLDKNNLKMFSATNIYLDREINLQTQGFERLGVLKLSNMGQKFNLQSNVATSFPNLKELDIPNNYANLSSNLFDGHFGEQLQILNISFNDISDQGLPFDFIKTATALEIFNLAGNNFKTFHLDFSGCPNLKQLDLRSNNIERFTTTTVMSLQQSGHLRNNVLQIDLGNNNLVCACDEESLKTISLIQMSHKYNIEFTRPDEYICISGKSANRIFVKDVDLSQLKHTCNPSNTKIILLVLFSNIIVISLTVSVLLAHKFRYRWYTAILRFRWARRERKEIGQSFKYDVFVSYCAEDRFWVHGTLMKELEDNTGFKLCIHYRDFMPGDRIADAIVKSIEQSRCTIIVLSQLSLQSEWCDFELYIAHAHSLRNRKRMIILKLGNIQVSSDTSPLVRELLDGRVYIEWPEVEPGNHETRSRNHETGSRNHETGSRNRETGSRNHETGSRNQQTESRNQETGNRNHETGSRNHETGRRNQDTGSSIPQTGSSIQQGNGILPPFNGNLSTFTKGDIPRSRNQETQNGNQQVEIGNQSTANENQAKGNWSQQQRYRKLKQRNELFWAKLKSSLYGEEINQLNCCLLRKRIGYEDITDFQIEIESINIEL